MNWKLLGGQSRSSSKQEGTDAMWPAYQNLTTSFSMMYQCPLFPELEIVLMFYQITLQSRNSVISLRQ